MHPFDQFESICRAMTDPGFYPHDVVRIERVDTHISAVFLTGKWAYKLKKPVDFGFLDFTRLDDRRRFCECEVSLNRRLSHDIYRDVVDIFETPQKSFSMTTGGRIAEYAVKMRQLDPDDCLKNRLEQGRVHPDDMKALGEMLAAFYESSNRGPHVDRFGMPETIAYNMEENFEQIGPFVGSVIDREKWECICQVSRSFFKNHLDLFAGRMEAGRIRDGHGDMRTDHVYFDGGIQIIDCIEFNERFRYQDAALDLAFLHMDMEHLGHAELSRVFLSAYAEAAGDPEIYTLLDFYASYRAVIRLKVSCLRLPSANDREKAGIEADIRNYTEQAYQYALRFSRPTLWIVCGLPATGKSTLADLLQKALSATEIQSDRLRKEIQPADRDTVLPFGRGLYRREMRQYVYGRMFALAQDFLKHGRSVILDATFSRRKWRDAARQMAQDLDTNVVFVECVCDPRIIRSRLKMREQTSGISDARIEHLPDMLADFEDLKELDPEIHLRVSMDRTASKALVRTLSGGYARRCAQVRKIA